MNNVNLIGRFGADPKVKEIEKDGKKFTSLNGSIAVQENKETVYWINVHASGTTADNISKYFKKGDRIGINGKLVTYKDKDDNYQYSVNITGFDFIEGKKVES